MNHYPGHVRDAFADWVDAGFPDTATVEVRYEPQQEPADVFLREMLDCSDTMPSHLCEAVGADVAYFGDVRGMSYGMAASVLLVKRSAGEDAAQAYVERLFGPVE